MMFSRIRHLLMVWPRQRVGGLALALLLTIPALLPLAAPGYFFNAHDGHHSVFWLYEFDVALRDGTLWPVWAPDHVLGFGYPLWLVYTPLAFFVAEAFHLLGLGMTTAVKTAWAFWFLVGAAGIYRLARRWWGPTPAVIAALAYTYAPYHLVDIYVRAAYAEFAALAIAPWALLGVVHVWENPRPRSAALAALPIAALLLTHSASPAVFLPLIAGLAVWKSAQAMLARAFRLRPATWTAIAFALGIGLALIFWLPALLERHYILEADWRRGTYDYTRHFVYPGQFFSTFWGYGFSVPGPGDGMSFGLGLIPWLIGGVGALAALGLGRSRLEECRAEALFLVVASLVALLAMTPLAAPAWRVIPLIASVQFPWRFLAVSTIGLALLAGAGVRWLENQAGAATPFPLVLALLIVLASFPYLQPQLTPIRPEDENALAIVEFEAKYPDMRGTTSFAQRRPEEATSPLIAQYLAGEPLRRAEIVEGEGEVLEQHAAANTAFARVRSYSDVRLRFYTNYFPGWQATVDGRPVEITADPPDGLIGLTLPPGEHMVRLRFTATPVRRLGQALSLIAAALIIGLIAWDRLRTVRHGRSEAEPA